MIDTGSASALAVLLPLSLAAGLDLYLTLAVLAGAGLLSWIAPPTGGLADLAAPWIVLAAAGLWLAEFWAERVAPVAVLWNTVHGVIRPVAGVLLALLLLEGHPPGLQAAGAVLAGVVAGLAHAARTGWSFLLWMVGAQHPPRLLISVAEDAVVLAFLSLLLEHALPAALLAVVVVGAGIAWTPPFLRAFLFQVRGLWGRTWGSLSPRRWKSPERFPRWVGRALQGDRLAPGGVLRGAAAGAVALPGIGPFRSGWVVIRGGTPLFLFRTMGGVASADLGDGTPVRVVSGPFHNRVEHEHPNGGVSALYFGKDGPTVEGLEAEFLG